MALLTTTTITEGSGTVISTTAASSTGDTFEYNDRTMLYVVNSSTKDSVIITIAAIQSSSFVPGIGNVTKADISLTLALGESAFLDTRSISYRGSAGLVSVTYDDVTDLSVAAVQSERV